MLRLLLLLLRLPYLLLHIPSLLDEDAERHHGIENVEDCLNSSEVFYENHGIKQLAGKRDIAILIYVYSVANASYGFKSNSSTIRPNSNELSF